MRTSNNLYKKEQRVIFVILFCFILSGLFLPTFKEKLLAKEIVEDTSNVYSLSDPLPPKRVKRKIDTVNKTDAEIQNDSEEILDIDETTEVSDDSTTDNTADDTQEPVERKNSSDSSSQKKSSNSSGSSSSGNKDSTSSGNKGSSSSGNNGSSSSGSGGSSTTPKKEWVPPVYKTVHHDAVYKTIKVVICNYCGATFNSAGEFQVHKDANGR